MQNRGLTDFGHLYPAANDGLKYHGIITQYVSEYVDLYYTDDASVLAGVFSVLHFKNVRLFLFFVGPNVFVDQELLDFFFILREKLGETIPTPNFKNLKILLAECIFRVTGWHTHVCIL
jgi:hypothetical protein